MALSRRTFLLGTAVASGAWVTWGGLPAWAIAARTAPAVDAGAFMRLSALLVNHQLNPATGARIAAAAAEKYADSAAMADAILAIATAKGAVLVEDFFADIPPGPLQELAHWVIFAWYTGCSSAKKDARVFSFEEALTYRTTADVVAIPSYGLTGPNAWSRAIVPLSDMPHF